MKKPRILFLSTSLNLGGTEKNLETFIRGLRDRYDFTVGYLKQNGLVGKSLENSGVEVRKFNSVFELSGYLRQNRFDILQTFLYRANVIGRIAARLTPRACRPAVISTQQSIDSWKNPVFAAIDGFTARWCDAVIANSETAKAVLAEREEIPEEKIRVVFNGIDLAKFAGRRAAADTASAEKPVIAWTSRLHKEKGADFLPEIASLVKKGSFLVIGDGPERQSVETAVKLFGLDKRFAFLGWRQDIAELLSAADMLLLPSREESFPQSVLEAMAMKLPVIAADVGGVRELVEDKITGFLVKKGDTKAFARALNSLADDPGLGKKMGLEGCRRAQGFTEAKMLKSIDAIYQGFIRR
jgi:glycosyltransferase involved in cell wall biosynthesis